MKKMIFLLFFGLFTCALTAADKPAAPAQTAAPVKAQAAAPAKAPAASQEWDFISFTFVPGVPPSAEVLNVYGVKVGIPFGFGEKASVAGTELSIITSMTTRIYGVQGAIINNDTDEIDGLQASFCANVAKTVRGLQFGCVNVAKDTSFQIGLVNIIKDSPLKVFPFVNVRF